MSARLVRQVALAAGAVASRQRIPHHAAHRAPTRQTNQSTVHKKRHAAPAHPNQVMIGRRAAIPTLLPTQRHARMMAHGAPIVQISMREARVATTVSGSTIVARVATTVAGSTIAARVATTVAGSTIAVRAATTVAGSTIAVRAATTVAGSTIAARAAT